MFLTPVILMEASIHCFELRRFRICVECNYSELFYEFENRLE